MKAIGPKKSFQSMDEKKEEMLGRVPSDHRDILQGIIDKLKNIFPKKLPVG